MWVREFEARKKEVSSCQKLCRVWNVTILQARKLIYDSLMNTGKRHKTPTSETELFIAHSNSSRQSISIPLHCFLNLYFCTCHGIQWTTMSAFSKLSGDWNYVWFPRILASLLSAPKHENIFVFWGCSLYTNS